MTEQEREKVAEAVVRAVKAEREASMLRSRVRTLEGRLGRLAGDYEEVCDVCEGLEAQVSELQAQIQQERVQRTEP